MLDLQRLVNAADIGQLALYHLVPPPARNRMMEMAFNRDMPRDVIITEDGMFFSLPADSEEIDIQQ